MKASFMVGIGGLLLVIIAWLIIFKGPSKPPFEIATMAGCYTSDAGEKGMIVTISPGGRFAYDGKATQVAAYEDKEGSSLLPAIEVVAASNTELVFAKGHPFLLRIDKDGRGFAVPSRTEDPLMFRKTRC